MLIPQETVGPYPLFNDIASAAAYQRDDITEGKTGVPLRLTLNIVNVNNGCAPILTAMVYVWHCDKDGYYSGYNQNGADLRGQTFLRGVQTTDTSGRSDVQYDLSRLVSGSRDAHPLSRVSRARLAGHLAARVPGFRDERGLLELAICREGPEPDDADERRHFLRRRRRTKCRP